MPDMVTGDIVVSTIKSTVFGQTVLATFGWVADTNNLNVNYEAALDKLNTQLSLGNRLYERYYNACPPEVVGVQFWHQTVKALRLYRRVYANTLSGAWDEQHAVTANLAAAITRRGDEGKRKDVSTLHMPAPDTSGAVAAGLLTQDYKDRLQALADEMKVSVTITAPNVTFKPIIINKGPAANYKAIIQTVVQPTARVMRRRTVGLGE